uniref:Cytochrome B6-F complex subunit n=2 Tax=unclassified Caudoviricetes TaxID=2788787 RepID=A0A8S5PKH8_9CAUD|nr:MAG TPA: cytochrome B6-F complex subunit [Siphoviridae sp. ctJcm18]DAE06676.1 MAG TPA: cytochrome B6-F complex subunit [Siphoviridae sp. ctUGQ45]
MMGNQSQQSIMKGGRKNMMEAILIGSIIGSIIAITGVISITSMYIIYRCTRGKKSFLWYIRHI